MHFVAQIRVFFFQIKAQSEILQNMGVVESAKGKSENGIHQVYHIPWAMDTLGGMTALMDSRQTRFQGY